MFMGPLEKSKPWNTKGLQGSYRFLQKVWKLCIESKRKINNEEPKKETLRMLHQTIKKVTLDLESLSFNTAVSQMMIFVNHLLALENCNNEVLRQFLILLNPFAPHISEQIFEILKFNLNGPISDQIWPKYEESYLNADLLKIVVQINGKTRGVIDLKPGLAEDDVLNAVITNEKFQKYIMNLNIIKKIYVPNRLVNLVIKD